MDADETLRRELLSDKLSDKSGSPEAVAYGVAFTHWFGLGPQPSRMLVSLYLANGAFKTVRRLATELNTSTEGVHRHICDLRKALDAEAIDCTRAEGYRLSDDGMAECRAALWTVGETLRMAS